MALVDDDSVEVGGAVPSSLEAALVVISMQSTQLAEQSTRLAEQSTQLAEQREEIAGLRKQLAELMEVVGRNSRNSNLPPSSDGPASGGGGKEGLRRRKSQRTRGGQKGHRGSCRALLPEAQVDCVVDLFPEACQGCARPLPREQDGEARRYQQLELVDHRPHLTEWRRHSVQCGHCRVSTRAAYDLAVLPRSAFGSHLTACVALLTGAYHLSRRKTQKLLQELFGIHVSLGAVSSMERRAAEALAQCHDEALREVQSALVKHTDATSWVRAGKLLSLWVLASTAVTVYKVLEDGRMTTIRPLFGHIRGILVSDRATVFTFWKMSRRQVCHAHLLRKYVAFSERDGPAGLLGRQLLECTWLLFEYWHGYKEGLLTRRELRFWMRPLQRAIEQLLRRAEKANIRGMSGSCADILAHRDALWTFLSCEGVEPTNNHAELELRDFVLWRKQSYGTQSERGDRFAERVMTVVHTLRKQNKNVLDFLDRSLSASLQGRPGPELLGAGLSASTPRS